MHVIFWERCLTGINKKAKGKAAYDEPVEAVSASCITGSAHIMRFTILQAVLSGGLRLLRQKSMITLREKAMGLR